LKSLKCLSILLAMSLSAVFAQPAVSSGGIRNAASNALDGLPNSGIAQGSYFTIYGSKLGPDIAALYSGPLPYQTSLAGTSVKVAVNGTSVDAAIYFTGANQINAILPSSTPVGTGTLTVTYAGQTSAPATIHVVTTAFGIYTLNSNGAGPGIFSNFNSATDQPLNLLNSSAHPGQYVILWGNGLGPVNPVNEFGAPQPGDLKLPVQLWVGGKSATVTYAGRSGCCVAEDQIVFIVPNDVPLGCHVPVAVQVGNVVSNFATLAVTASGATCSDAVSLSGDQITKAQTAGSFTQGLITLNRINAKVTVPLLGTLPVVSDQGTASFGRYTAAQLLSVSYPVGFVSTVGVCNVFTFQGTGVQFPTDAVQSTKLDGGTAINISGPNGAKQMTKQTGGGYSALLGGIDLNNPFGASSPGYLDPGSYTIDNGTGSTAVGPFKAVVTLGQPVGWTNSTGITNVDRTQPLKLTWNGGDPNGYVAAFGLSSTTNASVGFFCSAKPSDGSVTIPPAVLLSLPLSTGGYLGVLGASGNTPFTATGIDSGAVVVTSTNAQTVAYQ
jgi:uncharacterized protein (TIGR03437 family)